MQKNLWDAAYSAGTLPSAQPFPQRILASHAKSARRLRGFYSFYQCVVYKSIGVSCFSDCHLCPHLHHASGWYLKEVGGIAG